MSCGRQAGLCQKVGIPEEPKNLRSDGDYAMLSKVQKTSLTNALLYFIWVQLAAQQVCRQIGLQGTFAGTVGPRKHAQSRCREAHRRVNRLPITK